MSSIDHPMLSGLNKITDMVIVNLLVLVLTIPIITAGAAWTAMYYVVIKMAKDEESYVLKDFFKSFKENFGQATAIGLINIILIALFGINFFILGGANPENLSKGGIVALVLMALVVLAYTTYVYPMQAHYYNSVARTIKNAMLLSLANLPYTALFIVLTILPFIIVLTKYGIYLLPLLFVIGISGPAYICSKFWWKIFAKLDPEEKTNNIESIQAEE